MTCHHLDSSDTGGLRKLGNSGLKAAARAIDGERQSGMVDVAGSRVACKCLCISSRARNSRSCAVRLQIRGPFQSGGATEPQGFFRLGWISVYPRKASLAVWAPTTQAARLEERDINGMCGFWLDSAGASTVNALGLCA